MSLPDDEIREPEENRAPGEPGDESSGEQPVFGELDAEKEHAPEPDGAESEPVDQDTFGGDTADDMAATAGAESDETLDFAAPAEMESGIGFQAMDVNAEAADDLEEGASDDFLAGFVTQTEVTVEESEVETDEPDEVTDKKAKKRPAERAQRVLAAVGKSDPYTVLMGIALVALLVGILFFYLHLSAYNFDIWAERARQLLGMMAFGWLG